MYMQQCLGTACVSSKLTKKPILYVRWVFFLQIGATAALMPTHIDEILAMTTMMADRHIMSLSIPCKSMHAEEITLLCLLRASIPQLLVSLLSYKFSTHTQWAHFQTVA